MAERVTPLPLMRNRRDIRLLQRAGIELVDVGASFELFKPFQALLGGATYLGLGTDRERYADPIIESYTTATNEHPQIHNRP